MKKLLSTLACLLLAASLVLSGCVTVEVNQNTGEAENEAEAEKDLLDEILERGYINVGTEGTYAPNTYHDEDDNLVGFDVEVAALVAKYLGVEVHYVEMEWASIFAALDAGQIDTVINEVGWTEERAAKYDYSNPYAFVRGGILVRGDYDEINSFEDLEGKVAANESTSTWGALAQEYGATLDPVNAMAQSISEVLNGRADCTLNYITAFADYMKQQPDANVKVAVTSDPEPSSYIPVRKGETRLVDAINDALAKALESGELKEVSEKYFGVDVTENN
ncbi:MAG: transporter substrate-binding domain-containing protein [Lachnospiraceae bacterium]|nr:transporter substrate-binding domain-containing protein [Lachnospiraceae bacterium]